MRILSILITLLLISGRIWAQDLPADSTAASSATDSSVFTLDKPLTITLQDEEDEDDKPKEKKKKKNVYYDIKTRKAFARSGYGNSEKIELFYILKEWQDPDPYVRDIYWYEYKSKSVKRGGNPTPDKGMLLHGPYKLSRDGEVLEEGIFYKGTKHGRWATYRKMYDYYVLDTKEKYFKGWPKESEIEYYDRQATKLKEVVPVEYGDKEGNYFLFFEDGQLAVKGEFQHNERVGIWTEYYPGPKAKRKRELRYPKDPWERNFEPYIYREWDKEGKLIYENKENKG